MNVKLLQIDYDPQDATAVEKALALQYTDGWTLKAFAVTSENTRFFCVLERPAPAP